MHGVTVMIYDVMHYAWCDCDDITLSCTVHGVTVMIYVVMHYAWCD